MLSSKFNSMFFVIALAPYKFIYLKRGYVFGFICFLLSHFWLTLVFVRIISSPYYYVKKSVIRWSYQCNYPFIKKFQLTQDVSYVNIKSCIYFYADKSWHQKYLCSLQLLPIKENLLKNTIWLNISRKNKLENTCFSHFHYIEK